MAKRRKRREQSARSYDVEDLVDLVGALNGMRNGHGTPALTDPSVNVKERVELQAAFDKERRESDKEWQKRLDEQTRRADEASAKAEAGRIDAKFADVVSNALLAAQATTQAAQTLATTLASSTETLRKSQETTDLATRAAIRSVEQNQASGIGTSVQSATARATRQWELGVWATVGTGAALFIARLAGWLH